MEASTPPHGRCLSLSPTRSTPVARGPHERRCTRYVAMHPIRRGAMPTDRVHRLPQQAQPRAIRPHRPQPSTSDAATQLRHARADSAQEPLHPLRRAAPVTSRRTRYVAIHPIRRGAMPTDRVHRLPQQAKPRAFPPDTPKRLHQTQPHNLEIPARLRTRGATPVTSQCTRYVALHPLRRNAPDQKRCNAYGSGAPPLSNKPN